MWGILTKKQSAALTLEARIMNFLVLNHQVIPHRTGPSRQVLLRSRLPMSAYWLGTIGPRKARGGGSTLSQSTGVRCIKELPLGRTEETLACVRPTGSPE